MSHARLTLGSLVVALLVSAVVFLVVSGPDTSWNRSNTALASGPSGSTLFFPFVGKNTCANLTVAPLWRFGIARARRPITDYGCPIGPMRFGWYVDWGSGSLPITSYGIDYVPMVRVRQLKLLNGSPTSIPCAGCPYVSPYTYTVSLTPSQIQSMATSRPGMLWVIGNEIERRDWGTCAGCGQDEILPQEYAVAYHDVYRTIKNADPTAQVAIGGVIEATPLRLEYIQDVWDAYDQRYGGGNVNTMPVDVWNVHAFVLNEDSTSWGAGIPAGLSETTGMLISPEQNKDFTIAEGHIIALRNWMQQHGQRNKPLIITEYGVNIPAQWGCPSLGCPFSPQQVRDSFMYPSFNFFLNTTDPNIGFPADGNHLVQRWNWYSLDDDTIDPSNGQQAYNGNLFWSGLASNPQGIAPLGTYWQQYVQSLPPGAPKPY